MTKRCLRPTWSYLVHCTDWWGLPSLVLLPHPHAHLNYGTTAVTSELAIQPPVSPPTSLSSIFLVRLAFLIYLALKTLEMAVRWDIYKQSPWWNSRSARWRSPSLPPGHIAQGCPSAPALLPSLQPAIPPSPQPLAVLPPGMSTHFSRLILALSQLLSLPSEQHARRTLPVAGTTLALCPHISSSDN